MNKYLFIAVAMLSLAGAGCAKTVSETTGNGTSKEHNESRSENSGEHAGAAGHAVLAGSRIDLKNRQNLKPGEVELSFKLYGLDAHEFGPNDLKVAHEKLMHLILVREDMTQFQHVHPEYKNDVWTIGVDLPQPGNYQLYVDIEPVEEEPVVLRVPVTIGQLLSEILFPKVDEDLSVIADSIEVRLPSGMAFETNEKTMLTFSLTQNGKPVASVQPYLGAFGHVVVLRHGDAEDYLHAHPITETTPQNGQIQFATTFPAKGNYTIFAQFNIGGQVKTFPITISVLDKQL